VIAEIVAVHAVVVIEVGVAPAVGPVAEAGDAIVIVAVIAIDHSRIFPQHLNVTSRHGSPRAVFF
ncbi:MAG TPA: hypothetical protein VG711_08200, partial [Phycisphaerales bacterium]|nr:hypothetical protein [Phycisphaerales bacterium]